MATEMTPEQAAKLVQEALKQKIAEKREEIALMRRHYESGGVWSRIMDVLESQLAELMRGWRQQEPKQIECGGYALPSEDSSMNDLLG